MSSASSMADSVDNSLLGEQDNQPTSQRPLLESAAERADSATPPEGPVSQHLETMNLGPPAGRSRKSQGILCFYPKYAVSC